MLFYKLSFESSVIYPYKSGISYRLSMDRYFKRYPLYLICIIFGLSLYHTDYKYNIYIMNTYTTHPVYFTAGLACVCTHYVYDLCDVTFHFFFYSCTHIIYIYIFIHTRYILYAYLNGQRRAADEDPYKRLRRRRLQLHPRASSRRTHVQCGVSSYIISV